VFPGYGNTTRRGTGLLEMTNTGDPTIDVVGLGIGVLDVDKKSFYNIGTQVINHLRGFMVEAQKIVYFPSSALSQMS
jgi:hypothetical protein